MMEKVIYMNNAATSWPKPDCVSEAVAKALLARPGSANRGGLEDFDVFGAVRQYLAGLLGLSCAHQIALGANATWGLNLALQGLKLTRGAAVVTSLAEHNSVLRPLYKLAGRELAGKAGEGAQVQEGGERVYHGENLQLIFVPVDSSGRIEPQLWEQMVFRYRPELCVFTHASNVTGAVNEAALLAASAKKAGALVLVDASQTLGLLPLRAEDWKLDLIAFTGHKYLLGPQGTGGLYVRPGLDLEPLLCGGTGIKSDSDAMPDEMPLHLEAGTGNEPAYHGLLAALRWAQAHPPAEAQLAACLLKLRSGLKQAGAEVIVPAGLCTPVVSFNLPGKTAAEVGYILTECLDIVCRSGLHCAPKIFTNLGCDSTVRLSLSRFTTEEEVAAVVEAVGSVQSG
mgnify:CR=1 FL=1